MKMSEKFLVRVLGLSVVCLGALAGCSDDTTENNQQQENNSSMQCADGESFNPILGKCVEQRTDDPVITQDMGSDTNPDNPDGTVDQGTPSEDLGMADMSVDQGSGDVDMSMDMGTDMTEEEPDMMPDMAPADMGDTCGYGTILGVACVPSGDALPGATVTVTGIDCHTGQPFTETTTASSTGRYELTNIPSGSVEVTLESGSFNRTFTVSLDNGQMLDLTTAASKVCIEANNVKIAVIEGLYDDVQGILTDLQFEYEIKGNDGQGVVGGFLVADSAGVKQTRDFLMDPTAMAAYDVIFINCGTLWQALNANHGGDINTIVNNLFNYYQSGKSIYASDWAYIFIERPFPSVIDFYPMGGTDNAYEGPLNGYAPQVINATVESAALQGVLGTNSVAIDFPQNQMSQNIYWAMMSGADTNAVVHLTGNATICSGDSCSVEGPAQQGIPLLVTYKSPTHGGSLAFTSFHNHPAGTPVSPEIAQILKFLILQL